MKIISIVSSGRKNGNTERVVRCIEEEISKIAVEKDIKVELEQINLGSVDIKFCKGCRVCFDKGEEHCFLKDELLKLRDKISTADGVILASPVYVEDVNGIMKNWIDRMAFNCHRPAFSGKVAAIITTSGIGSTSHALKTMKTALQTWGFYVAVQRRFKTGGLIEREEINSRYSYEIKDIAKTLVTSIYNYKAKNPSIYSLMVFKVQQKYWQKARKESESFDYLYWENKGWLEEKCNYYMQHNSSILKIKVAAILGNIVSKFFN